jgi:hypothetical protein
MLKLTALLASVVIGTALPALGHAAPDSISVETGGVGLEERAALDAVRDRYNLRVAFAKADGEYVADVEVRLSAADGKGVYYSGRTDGPYLFARLDPGRYRLEATYAGVTQVRTLTVSAAQSQPYVYVRWPDSAARAGGRG